MDYSKMENRLVDVIADDKLSLLSAVMKDDDAYIRNNRALTKKSIISLAIAEQYKEEIQEATNIRNIAKWIIEATDYMMGLYADAFVKNPYEVKKTSMINNKNIFFGYIALAKAVQNKDGWKQKIKDKMASIDFSIDNPLWRELGLTIESLGKDNQKVMLASNNDANKTTRNKLYKLLTEGV
jgi:hypothetical protein